MRYGLVLGLAALLAGCSGGGGSSGVMTIPTLPWGNFRHDATNSGVGAGINNNNATGNTTPLVDATKLGGVTGSTPTIDNNGNMYIGTQNGLLSLDSSGSIRWRVTECVSSQCAPGVPHSGSICTNDGNCGGAPGSCMTTTVNIGRVDSSPTVTPGNAVVFGIEPVTTPSGTQPGAVIALQQQSNNSVPPQCLWAFRPPDTTSLFSVHSSAATQVSSFDFSLLTVLIGTNDGRVYAINSDGTTRWAFPPSAAPADVSSSPAVSFGGVTYVTTGPREGLPGGTGSLLTALDFSGREFWQVNIGAPPDTLLLPSPATASTVYALGGTTAGSGRTSVLYGINPNGSLKWQYIAPMPISGSPSFSSQSIDQGSNNVVDTLIYLVTIDGSIIGISDANGGNVMLQRCSLEFNTSCQMDTCLPDEGTCTSDNRCSLTDAQCRPDTCPVVMQCAPGTPNAGNSCTSDADCGDVADSCVNEDVCQVITGMDVNGGVPVADHPVHVSTSPAVSGDVFVVVGTDTGELCARALDNSVPGDDNKADNPWVVANGCLTLGSGHKTLSSPAIGASGSIHVTTDEGLFVIE